MPEIRHWVQEATGSKAQPPYPGGFDPQFGPRDYGKAAGLAWALYPADKSASIPMGFEFEKEAVGENPQVTDEFAAAVKRG